MCLTGVASHFGTNLNKHTAVNSPSVTPKTTDNAVTYNEPTIMGSIPYCGTSPVGCQTVPNKKLPTPISTINGKPLANKNTVITPSANMEKKAQITNTPFINFSLVFRLAKKFILNPLCYLTNLSQVLIAASPASTL